MTASDKFVNLVPLGGFGEIGLNMMAIQYADSTVVIDAGLMFPEEEMFGIDAVIPDFAYLRGKKETIDGLLVTHGHEDHIGAIPFFVQEFRVPVYGTRFTLALIREKLREHNLVNRVNFVELEPGKSIEIGALKVEPFSVCHSIPDGVGLIIDTPEGTIIHSGDFKIDYSPAGGNPTDFESLKKRAARGIKLLLSDSTNVEREGSTLSESQIRKTFSQIFEQCTGRIIIAVFASNIYRIQQIVDVSIKYGRKILFHGKSIQTNVRIAEDLGYLHIDPSSRIFLRDLSNLPDNRIVIITTGSQGEPMSALTRIAFDDHKWIKLKRGDTVILSSKFIPGNERTIHNVINHLYRKGAEVIYEKVNDIHVSGHAYRDELRELISILEPEYFVPIHGEYRHLVKHCALAVEAGVPEDHCFLLENGDTLQIFSDRVIRGPKVAVGRVFVDGKGVGDVGKPVLRDRKHLAEDGLVIVSIVIDQEFRDILSGPDVFSRGFVSEDLNSEVLYCAQCLILEIFDRFMEEGLTPDTGEIQRRIRKELRKFFYRVLGRRPVIYPIVVEV